MTTKKVILGCTALAGTGKRGILKPDKDGYYEMVLGALDVFNSAGEFYPGNAEAKSQFSAGSTLQRRISGGSCRGEIMHPPKLPGMSQRDWAIRLMEIYPDKVSHHHKSIWLDSSGTKLQNGKPVVLIMGLVKPAGPYGESLEASLKNPDENVAFSIRSFTANALVGCNVQKTLKTVVCFDHVNEGGIEFATKYNTPTLESLGSQQLITPELLELISGVDSGRTALESNGINTEIIKTSLGWNKTQIIKPSELISLDW